MGRAPCCDKANVKKGPWSPEEDLKLKEYINKYGTGGNWIALPQKVGLKRCGKSCRLRWLNYLRPNIKHGEFSDAEDRIICTLFATIGSRWSIIAAQLPGRTDNDIKNYWNTKLKKKLMGLSPLLVSPSTATHQPASSNKHQQLISQPHHDYQSTTTTFTPSPPPSSYCLISHSSGLDYPVASSSTTDLLNTCPAYAAFQPVMTKETLLMNSSNNSACSFQFQQPYPSEAASLLKENNNSSSNFLMFGGGGREAPSCSSSDGSSGNFHVSHGNKDRDFEYGSEQQQHQQPGMGFQSSLFSNLSSNGRGSEEDNKLMMMTTTMMGYNNNNIIINTECGWTNYDNGKPPTGDQIWSESSDPASLEYYGSIEEIKQLLSSSNNGGGSSITVDEIKTEEEEEEEQRSGFGGMYYY